MNKFYKLLIILLAIHLSKPEQAKSQCQVIDTLIFGFADPNGSGYFSGFLCSGTDSVGTEGPYGYYNADSYSINLVVGTDVIFSIDSCNGNQVSMTVSDSLLNIIPGAYESAGCPNALTFNPPYTGKYYLTLNLNGTCGVPGGTLLGQASVKIDPGSTPPDCPAGSVINDTICGAVSLTVNAPFIHGNTSLAFATDPLDAYIMSVTTCSSPNNTMWYSFTAPTDFDTLYIWLTSTPGGGFHSNLLVFSADDLVNSCTGSLSYLDCQEGPDDGGGMDTVVFTFFGVQANHIYYFMIDGYSGSVGEFSIALRDPSLNTAVLQYDDRIFSVFPNPAFNSLHVKSLFKDAVVTIINSFGQEVFLKEFENLSNQEIDVSTIPAGLYTINVKSRDRMISKKLQISR
jgi:hypothetical protein